MSTFYSSRGQPTGYGFSSSLSSVHDARSWLLASSCQKGTGDVIHDDLVKTSFSSFFLLLVLIESRFSPSHAIAKRANGQMWEKGRGEGKRERSLIACFFFRCPPPLRF